jgi:hypothetical protein
MSRGPNSVPTSSFQPQASAKPPILIDDIDDIDAPGHLGKVEQHVPTVKLWPFLWFFTIKKNRGDWLARS